MSEDIRISVDFLTHRKRKKLQRKLGADGVLSTIDLWLSTAVQRPLGTLTDYSLEDIEIDANWEGEQGLFVKTLLEIGLLDEKDGVYSLHNWETRQGWVSKSEERGDKARFSRLARSNPNIYKELKRKGIDSLSKEDYQKYKKALKNVNKPYNESLTTVNESYNESLMTVNDTSTPAPSPSPSPTPNVVNNTPLTPQGKKVRVPKSKKLILNKTQQTLFDKFYSAYPKKRSKGAAQKAFLSVNPNEQLVDRMVSKIEQAKTSGEWQKQNGRFIPYPATWLNATGWEDEILDDVPVPGCTNKIPQKNGRSEQNAQACAEFMQEMSQERL